MCRRISDACNDMIKIKLYLRQMRILLYKNISYKICIIFFAKIQGKRYVTIGRSFISRLGTVASRIPQGRSTVWYPSIAAAQRAPCAYGGTRGFLPRCGGRRSSTGGRRRAYALYIARVPIQRRRQGRR